MSDVTETKPDLTSTTAAAAESTETPVAEKPAEKTGEEEKSVTEKATDATLGAASKTSDSVFSMFGGGPKKEKKEDDEEVEEPSGSSKAQKKEGDEVSFLRLLACNQLCRHCLSARRDRATRSWWVHHRQTAVTFSTVSLSFIQRTPFICRYKHAGSNGVRNPTGRGARIPRGPL